MLHVLVDEKDETAWYPNYLSGLKKGLESAGIPYLFSPDLPTDLQQPVLITRYTLFDQIKEADPAPENLYIQEHDVWNPFTNVLDLESLWIFKHPSLKAIFYTNPSMVPWGQRCLPAGSDVDVVAAGFPYDHDYVNATLGSIDVSTQREKLIVFPGRMNEFYQPYLSVRLAFEFMDLGYRVVIASPVSPLSHYPVAMWRELGIEVGRLPHAEYYQLLSKATAAVSVTIGGSLTLALYEAQLLGATPIAPKGRHHLPPFTEMYSPRYDLLNPREAIDMVENNVSVQIDERWFSIDTYVHTLWDVIQKRSL
ncbi:hypothetical protein A8709_17895 [Paenibacillus pectinilyticus]|uniref:Glycosyltransferase n=1 Tax=Paenibacillus pectinilyticus TaxID=512399 RepID=A0A1C0ZZB2_9BACL|nr:hypothetical protein [Paenibacillus pectinilyticus]OCT13477.1 hypothetical protein A8709_17895 [Paenibacillus pectinilyticus]